MTFTAQYTSAENTSVSRSDMPGAAIPADPANRHYAEILAAGIEIAPYVAPPKTPDQRRAEIDRRLHEIDLATMRPLRAIQAGTATQADHDRLTDLEAEAATLRAEREGLAQ